MSLEFPIPIPKRLPVRINPCPIVEAIFEVRFTSAASWETLPGLLYGQIRERYPEQMPLPLAQVPEGVRKLNPVFANLPLIQFTGKNALVQVGPRQVSLVTQANRYPGWKAVSMELAWLLERLEQSGVINETERLGVRYIDFFPGDVLPQLVLTVKVNERPLEGSECTVTTVLHRDRLAIRLQVTNAAILPGANAPQRGTVLDMDAWFGALDVDVFKNGTQRFAEAHQTSKEIFYGLLRPEFLASLRPEYAS